MNLNKSAWKNAKRILAGGVDSPVRAFRAVGGEPIFMRQGKGAYLTDIDRRRYVDLCCSWGALVHGHAFAPIRNAIARQALAGTSFGTVTELETRLGDLIHRAFPAIQKIRFVSSGTEAAMSAIRLARGFTGRKRIVKFEGCYHGHADSLLVKAGSGLATFGTPDSAGVPDELARLTSVVAYNDTRALREIFRRHKDIAAVIVEPVAANMGVVLPTREFLRELREITRRSKALLIFDEVITGFRIAYGGAAERFGIRPDLICLGKIIAGGLPVGAFGGRQDIMKHLSPEGAVYQAGTLSGNPISMAAGVAAVGALKKSNYEPLQRRTAVLAAGIEERLRRNGHEASVPTIGSMFTVFFRSEAPRNWTEVAQSNRHTYARFFRHMLHRGVYMAPSAYETCFLSHAHTLREARIVWRAVESFKN